MSGDDLQGVIKLSVGLLCAAALVLILIIVSGNELDDTSGQAIGTAVALAFFSLTAVAGSHLRLRQPQLELLGAATVCLSALAFLVVAWAIWSEDHWETAGIFLVLAVACGHSSVLLTGRDEREDDSVRLVRGGTLAVLWLLAVLLIAELADAGGDVSPQAIGVLAVLYLLGTLLLPLLRRMAPAPLSKARAPARRRDELPLDHVCLVWPGSIDSAVAGLAASGAQLVEGPAPRNGAHGSGLGVSYREPDGTLVELISYR